MGANRCDSAEQGSVIWKLVEWPYLQGCRLRSSRRRRLCNLLNGTAVDPLFAVWSVLGTIRRGAPLVTVFLSMNIRSLLSILAYQRI